MALGETMRDAARQLADARSLTLQPTLSDALGRLQIRLERILIEVLGAARQEAEAHGRTAPARLGSQTHAAPAAGGRENGLNDDWPYLAL